jgi:hypothetical protein
MFSPLYIAWAKPLKPTFLSWHIVVLSCISGGALQLLRLLARDFVSVLYAVSRLVYQTYHGIHKLGVSIVYQSNGKKEKCGSFLL